MSQKKEIEIITNLVEQMFNAVINNTETAISYYLDTKKSLDINLIIDDDKINAYERAIESLCMQIFLKETIYSRDFREVSASLEIIESLERVGDNAYDIKMMGDSQKKEENIPLVSTTYKLSNLVLKMLKDSFSCFVKGDIILAEQIIKSDDEVDKLYWDSCMNLAKDIDNHFVNGKSGVYQCHVLKYLERIADQSTNIAEWTIFIQTGYHKDKVII